MSYVQRIIVLRPPLPADHRRRIALSDQDEVHEESSRAAVSINERMNVHQAEVSQGRPLHWMQLGCFSRIDPGHQLLHQRGHLDGTWWHVGRARNVDLALSIGPSTLVVNTPQDQGMGLADVVLSDGFCPGCQGLDEINSMLVVDGFQVFLQGFPTHCQPVEEYQAGFA